MYLTLAWDSDVLELEFGSDGIHGSHLDAETGGHGLEGGTHAEQSSY